MIKHAPLRVCHIISGDVWGGAEVVAWNLLTGQAARGDLEVSLIILNEGRLEKLAREAGVPMRLVHENGSNLWALARAVDTALANFAPSIIHTHRYKENLLSYLLVRRHGARSVVTIHGYEVPTTLARMKFELRRYFLFPLAWLVEARFVAVSEDLRTRFRLSQDRCVIIPNGIRIPSHSAREDISASPIQPRSPVIGWVGRMVPVKGLATLLDAMMHMPSPVLPRLLLVGDGPERATLERHAECVGIRSRVEFTGHVDDPTPYFGRMDIFAFPSLYEGVPIALLEAMAHGIPAVVASVGGIPGFVGSGGAVRFVPSRSPKVWASAIQEVLANPEEARSMAENAQRLVDERFSLKNMVDRYVELYHAALT